MNRFVVLSLALTFFAAAQQPGTPATDQEKEEFLRTATVTSSREIPVGVTHTRRAALTKSGYTHDAHIQTINESQREYRSARGVEINFTDTYKYNIAGYRLDRLLGLNMMPVSVQRKIGGTTAAVTWWVDDVQMMELERHNKRLDAPDPEAWKRQMFMVRIFNELTYDSDANLGNLLIDKNWRLWIIDKTRAFRLMTNLRTAKTLEDPQLQCDRKVYAALKVLDQPLLEKQLMPFLTKPEIKAVLARRDRIVKIIDTHIASRGEANVLYDRQ